MDHVGDEFEIGLFLFEVVFVFVELANGLAFVEADEVDFVIFDSDFFLEHFLAVDFLVEAGGFDGGAFKVFEFFERRGFEHLLDVVAFDGTDDEVVFDIFVEYGFDLGDGFEGFLAFGAAFEAEEFGVFEFEVVGFEFWEELVLVEFFARADAVGAFAHLAEEFAGLVRCGGAGELAFVPFEERGDLFFSEVFFGVFGGNFFGDLVVDVVDDGIVADIFVGLFGGAFLFGLDFDFFDGACEAFGTAFAGEFGAELDAVVEDGVFFDAFELF